MIRIATINDLETICTYNALLAKESEDLILDRDQLLKGVKSVLTDTSKGCYFVYELNNIIAGQLLITYEWSDWRNANFWWIQSVYVHEEYRHQGIFSSLYNHVKNIVLNDISICGLRLYVEKENTVAQSTYKYLQMKASHYHLYEWKK